jgi:hypothetical protein
VLTGETLRNKNIGVIVTEIFEIVTAKWIICDKWSSSDKTATMLSSDQSPPHFFLSGFLKEILYSNNPRSLEELKHNAEQTVANMTQKH